MLCSSTVVHARSRYVPSMYEQIMIEWDSAVSALLGDDLEIVGVSLEILLGLSVHSFGFLTPPSQLERAASTRTPIPPPDPRCCATGERNSARPVTAMSHEFTSVTAPGPDRLSRNCQSDCSE
jgi:hypothetical protein